MKTFKNLTINKLLSDASLFDVDPKESYILTYPEFIKYFNGIERIEKHHLVIGSHFVYGWMPTIIELRLDRLDKTLDCLNKAKSSKLLNEDELEHLKRCINNSLVGLSKLLHFINPEVYAIWDSRIFRYLTEKNTPYGIDKTSNYINYLEGLNDIVGHPNFHEIHSIVQNHFEYSLTPMRAAELTMFQAERKLASPLEPLFFHEPKQWGLRGDPYLWRELKALVTSKKADSLDEFEKLLLSGYEKLTKKSLKQNEEILVERYNFGGMSGGFVSSNFWIQTGMPLLLERYGKAGNKHQN